MTHLTSDALVDAVEGALSASDRAHLAGCAECEQRVHELRALLTDVHEASIPEPSPLFWHQLSARVRLAIDAEPATSASDVTPWFRWPVLVPLGALGVLILALAVAIPRGVPTPSALAPPVRPAAAPEIDLSQIGEQEWAVLAELIGVVDIDEAREAGIALNPGDAERAALALDADEQQELIRLMKAEMERSGG